ncbi:hypothetical protein RvY_00106 [Ramazzottius varieornatus]|uniref:Ubiquitin-like protease family profile domain-containing protein n=1 Tax=Ramazzottius varieornatus TaxID=947166 RepID=A0A1D1ULK5_RAMVA|nr:hypothetical protein RvY_00106 [Ramazzottius varieornatus]
MNTFELWDALHHDPHGKDKTAGVFPRDYLAKIRKRRYPFGVIINTSKASDRDGGTHWVAVWIQSGKEAEFFDSFGKTAIFYGAEIHDFITRMAPQCEGKYKEDYTQLQHPSSDLCVDYIGQVGSGPHGFVDDWLHCVGNVHADLP